MNSRQFSLAVSYFGKMSHGKKKGEIGSHRNCAVASAWLVCLVCSNDSRKSLVFFTYSCSKGSTWRLWSKILPLNSLSWGISAQHIRKYHACWFHWYSYCMWGQGRLIVSVQIEEEMNNRNIKTKQNICLNVVFYKQKDKVTENKLNFSQKICMYFN
jgi:hypothetical protein